ncbi:MAG: hypothetical protein KKB62_02025 [Nanoarchaeota archaeon]|nr:hypothetical protein [Nanoarchaeota archaeon]
MDDLKKISPRGKIDEARKVYKEFYHEGGKFYNKSIVDLDLGERKDLVGIFYKDINGISLKDIPPKQIYALSYRFHKLSEDLVLKYGEDSKEELILNKIKNLENLSGGYERDRLLESLSIELEDELATNVSFKFNCAIGKIYPFNNYQEDVPF